MKSKGVVRCERVTRDAGHHPTWAAKNTTKTNISSALVRSVVGTTGVTTVSGLCAEEGWC
jgi:hypothetical protein